MENFEIASVLGELADLLEIKGANPFRIRAYRNAIRTIQDLTEPLSVMVEEERDLTELPGIGKDLAGHIRELVESGKLGLLEEVGKEVPRTLTDLIRLDGVGPKKAEKLWRSLGVTSVDELEEALQGGEVAKLEGFGDRSAEKMVRAISDFRSYRGRFLLSDADLLVAPLVEYLEETPGVVRVDVAGSYRRRKETVGDLDVLVLCDSDPDSVMNRFLDYPGAVRVESGGRTKGRLVLRSGLPADVRVVPQESFGAALHYFSGSKEHNVAVRALSQRKGLKINEYGVFRIQDGTEVRVGGESEEDVFEAVGLSWIPPHLRENRGEMEAAANGTLPDLLGPEDIRGDLQMHTTWSDGANSLLEMAEACRERGYQYMAVTDHSQAVTVAGGLTPERVRDQWEEYDLVRSQVEGIRVFRSLEVDILKNGSLDMPDEILRDLDLVLVSVHSFMNMSKAEMTDRVLRALEHPEVDILAHPTGRILNRRVAFEMDVETVLQCAAERQVAVELNAHPHRLDLHDRHVQRAKELGAWVVINTDAHSVQDLGLITYGVDQARRGWLEPGDVLNALSLEDFLRWTERRRGPESETAG